MGVRGVFAGVFASVALRLTSPLWPTLMKAHIGWKAPVPQARRWVRLWGCRRRTKLAHSDCGTQKCGQSLMHRFSKKYSKRYILRGSLPPSTLSGLTHISGSLPIPFLQFRQSSAAGGKKPDECRGSANRDMSMNRGPREAQGRLLPLSCM